MSDHPRPFHKLIRAQQEIDPHRRQFQHRRGQKAKRYRITPHVDRVADKAEAAVPARPENAGNQRGIDRLAHHVIGIDQQHSFQEAFARLRQVGKP